MAEASSKNSEISHLNQLIELLVERDFRLATAESCTGGLIAKLLTDRSGSSAWYEGGFVTYSNAMKQSVLGVPQEVLEKHGAVSAQTVKAMAEGALVQTGAQVAVSVSGIAGPTGGSKEKPVGTVFIGWAAQGAETKTGHYQFDGDRASVRDQTAEAALGGLIDLIKKIAR